MYQNECLWSVRSSLVEQMAINEAQVAQLDAIVRAAMLRIVVFWMSMSLFTFLFLLALSILLFPAVRTLVSPEAADYSGVLCVFSAFILLSLARGYPRIVAILPACRTLRKQQERALSLAEEVLRSRESSSGLAGGAKA